MKKSTKYYRIAFVFGLLAVPFVALASQEMLRNIWFLVCLGVLMSLMFGFTLKAVKHEEYENEET
jgi:hypothetical protein